MKFLLKFSSSEEDKHLGENFNGIFPIQDFNFKEFLSKIILKLDWYYADYYLQTIQYEPVFEVKVKELNYLTESGRMIRNICYILSSGTFSHSFKTIRIQKYLDNEKYRNSLFLGLSIKQETFIGLMRDAKVGNKKFYEAFLDYGTHKIRQSGSPFTSHSDEKVLSMLTEENVQSFVESYQTDSDHFDLKYLECLLSEFINSAYAEDLPLFVNKIFKHASEPEFYKVEKNKIIER